MGRFDRRVALVTGGASGIGTATVTRLRDEGGRAAILDLCVDGASADLAIAGDVTSSQEVDAAVDRVERELGPIDILICAAGVGGFLPTAELSDEEFDRIFAVNTAGTFYANRAVLARMGVRGYGRVVNVASVAGKDGSGSAAYAGSKAAVIAMSQFLGREYAANGVLVNSVAPGPIETPLLRAQIDDARREAMVQALPVKRLGTPEDVAALILFLASDDLQFSAGACFDASGGRASY